MNWVYSWLSLVSGTFYISQLSVGAKHLKDKLSVITKNSSPNASPVQLSVVMGKHLEDKLSVITKNSSPNASPVQLSVVMGKHLEDKLSVIAKK
ncbi:hypothetical protein BMF77_01114 [Dolichospermum sp. UHCC 0315A]|nr:hypothetical protein BMF77_01114 [Dolichospermum sp. UHCC 0315A]